MDYLKLKSKYLIPAVVIVAVAIAVAGGGYVYSQAASQTEATKLVSEVGKLIELPMGETPTIATVTDAAKLKDQPFFQNAKNGDKVLIYTNAKKAILYDPQAKKVIEMAPINIGTPSATLGTGPSAQTLGPKIVLRNGTKTSGLTTKVEAGLKKVIANLNVIAKENATLDYDKTIIVVLNSVGSDLAQNLTKVLNASRSALPAGEGKPKDGDILILIGEDRI